MSVTFEAHAKKKGEEKITLTFCGDTAGVLVNALKEFRKIGNTALSEMEKLEYLEIKMINEDSADKEEHLKKCIFEQDVILKTGHWISVEDKLPDPNQYVLIAMTKEAQQLVDKDIPIDIGRFHYEYDRFDMGRYFLMKDEVKSWTPIPSVETTGFWMEK